MKRITGLPLLFLLLAACSPAARAAATPQVGAGVTPAPTIVATLTPGPTQTPAASPQWFFSHVEKYCPANREVSISRLGAGQDLQLILTDAAQKCIWGLTLGGSAPVLIAPISPSKWFDTAVSPDGKWMAYSTVTPNSSEVALVSLTTGETKTIWNPADSMGVEPHVSWLSQREVLVENAVCQQTSCSYPLGLVNISTGVLKDMQVDGIFSGSYQSYRGIQQLSGGDDAFFSASGNLYDYNYFLVYDYSSGEPVRVFPWLEQRILFYPGYPSNLSIAFSRQQTALLVQQSYGFDLDVVDNSLAAFTASMPYDAAMKRIGTPVDFELLRYDPLELDSSTGLLYFYRTYNDRGSPVDSPTHYGAFIGLAYRDQARTNNPASLEFRDYCFSETGSNFRSISPDGQIAVFETYQPGRLTLLNLATGDLAHLAGWQYMGWRSTGQ